MKHTFFAILLLLAAIAPAAAQEMSDPALVAAVEALRKALVDPTKADLDKLTMDELSYGHSSGLIQDKAAFEESLLSGASDFVSIELSDQTLKVVGNTAWVRHKLSAVTNDGGKPGEAHLSVLLIWMKQKGQWRLLARQAVKIVPAQ
ncbi:MAG TPA: nuclear transport factor 2 family protein [Puia sp.]|nr:nuclear transport factor 2 family protein [Puia sp.]